MAEARARHFELRSLLEQGVDPAEARCQETAERRQQAKDSHPAADQFEAFSRRWIRERLMTRSKTYRNQIGVGLRPIPRTQRDYTDVRVRWACSMCSKSAAWA